MCQTSSIATNCRSVTVSSRPTSRLYPSLLRTESSELSPKQIWWLCGLFTQGTTLLLASYLPCVVYVMLISSTIVCLWVTVRRKTNTVKPVFKTTWEIGTTWEIRPSTSVPRSIHYIVMDLRNKTTSEFRTDFHSPLGVPISQVPLYNATNARVVYWPQSFMFTQGGENIGEVCSPSDLKT